MACYQSLDHLAAQEEEDQASHAHPRVKQRGRADQKVERAQAVRGEARGQAQPLGPLQEERIGLCAERDRLGDEGHRAAWFERRVAVGPLHGQAHEHEVRHECDDERLERDAHGRDATCARTQMSACRARRATRKRQHGATGREERRKCGTINASTLHSEVLVRSEDAIDGLVEELAHLVRVWSWR